MGSRRAVGQQTVRLVVEIHLIADLIVTIAALLPVKIGRQGQGRSSRQHPWVVFSEIGGDGVLINLGVFLAGEQDPRKQISKRVEERLRQRQRARLTLHEIQIQVSPGGGRWGRNES